MENFKNYSRIKKRFENLGYPQLAIPDLLETQTTSFNDFLQRDVYPQLRKNEGLQSVFNNIFPIEDNKGLFTLEFLEYEVKQEKYGLEECKLRNLSYEAMVTARLRLTIYDEDVLAETGERKVKNILEQDVILGNIPIITKDGTFLVNGAERAIISQLHRSYGVFFTETKHPSGKPLYSAKVIPERGTWLEFSMDVHNVVYVYINKRRKMPISILLRVVGYSEDQDIRKVFYDNEVVPLADAEGKKAFEDIFSPETGEVLVAAGVEISIDMIDELQIHGLEEVAVISGDINTTISVIENTLEKDGTSCTSEASHRIYTLMRPGENPSEEDAASFVNSLFFDDRRYSIGKVGRYNINKKLELDLPEDQFVLSKEDIIAIIKRLISIFDGKDDVDNIDYLENRRVRSVGELLQEQYNIGLSRLARVAVERMAISSPEEVTIYDLINSNTLSSVVQSFFLTGQLSQFMEQTNPLAELTHKRRFTALGPGGLERERAGMESRDVNNSHYGRICPIETPEGPNIGLINSPAIFSRVNAFGFLETPYYKVENGVVLKDIVYLNSAVEAKVTVAQAGIEIDDNGKIVRDFVFARKGDEFLQVAKNEINYLDVSPMQAMSLSTTLIPFLEHNDASRALMGSNMQRQAVPLLNPEFPVVGTGMEKVVARSSANVRLAPFDGKVIDVTAEYVELEKIDDSDDVSIDKTYRIEFAKYKRSNQDTCINQRPVVKVGQIVKNGDFISDGPSVNEGRLALGRNLKVAFMSWYGYNYEDAIILNEKVAWEDAFTSLYIEEKEVLVREMKSGREELVYDIPDVSKYALRNLDKTGVIRLGSVIESGDIIVGKITPKSSDIDPSPEENLMRALFGDRAGDFTNTSLKAKPGMEGVVVDVRVFSREEDDLDAEQEKEFKLNKYKKDFDNRNLKVQQFLKAEFLKKVVGKTSKDIKSRTSGHYFVEPGKKITKDDIEAIDFKTLDLKVSFTTDQEFNKIFYDTAIYRVKVAYGENENIYKKLRDRVRQGDELDQGVFKMVKVYIAKKRKISVGDKMAGRHGNKGVVSKIAPIADMPFTADGEAVDIVLNPLGVPSRMNIGQIFETHLGIAAKILGFNVETPVFDGATEQDILDALDKAGLDADGKQVLYDGKTGERFDQRVTVGMMYMLKLNHLVKDKMHARSTGPYSLITQQPLGGKAQHGGQRLGEMEVWALEAYGAANLLKEMVTIKSDDMQGRTSAFKSIVSGENPIISGTPESFMVLVSELKSLGFDIEFLKDAQVQE